MIGWRICAKDFLGDWVCSYAERETPEEAFAVCVQQFPPSAKYDNHMVRNIQTKEEYYLLINKGIPPDEQDLPILTEADFPEDVLPLI